MIEIFLTKTLTLLLVFTKGLSLEKKKRLGLLLTSTMDKALSPENELLLRLSHRPFVNDYILTKEVLSLLVKIDKNKQILKIVFQSLPVDYPNSCFKVFVKIMLENKILSPYEMQVLPRKKMFSTDQLRIMLEEVNSLNNKTIIK
jgi:hypothetical protein